MTPNARQRIEFGDLQTPLPLARAVCTVVSRLGFSPASVVEPTCGRGAFLVAALEAFPTATHFLGLDRNASHVREARHATETLGSERDIRILHGDFFTFDWSNTLATLPKPILVIGNPPWVTSATLGSLRSSNRPPKFNPDGLRGIDALTGKANFDISELMLRTLIQYLAFTQAILAVLCKTTVARKTLLYAWSRALPVTSAHIRRFNASSYFGVSVDACLLVATFSTETESGAPDCLVYDSLHSEHPEGFFGLRDAGLVANVRLYERWKSLLGRGLSGWRSGIKHDCAKVFELVRSGTRYINGLGECIDLESEVVFPLMKGSDIARNRPPRKWLLVPQRTMTDSPSDLQRYAPKAWRYLLAKAELLNKRRSAIYKDMPCFSVFGVGDYSFTPWKVAISALHKKLSFIKIGPFEGRPVVLDDTCYFFPCHTELEAQVLHDLVQSQPAQEFLSSLIFWDAKRPITADILNCMNLAAVARAMNIDSAIVQDLAARQTSRYRRDSGERKLPLGD